MPNLYTILKQGEDSVASIQILDKSGVAVDLTAVPNIKAFIKVNGVEQSKRYALNPSTGVGTLTVNGTIDNQIDIVLEREETASYPEGIMRAIVLVSETDGTFGDGDKVTEYSANIGKVLIGEGKSEPLP